MDEMYLLQAKRAKSRRTAGVQEYRTQAVAVNGFPPSCPYCNKAVEFVVIDAFVEKTADEKPDWDTILLLVLRCPNSSCSHLVVAGYDFLRQDKYYEVYDYWGFFPPSDTAIRPDGFSNALRKLSPEFIKIYEQAQAAEVTDLDQISGPGYRKALEFLVKDLACTRHPTYQEEIRASPLGACIKTYIDDERIRACATRAAWLGNDETHYERRWERQTLDDLKKLIRLTVSWIENDLATRQYLEQMP